MKPTLKVFIMTVIGFLITTLSTLADFNFAYVAIVTVVFAVTYWVKNYFMPSDSPEGTVFWKDIVSGLIIAVCMAASTFAGNLLTGIDFSWQVLWVAVSGAVVGYFTKTIAQGKHLVKV